MVCLYTIHKFKIFLHDKTEFTLRTDCQVIVDFYHKLNNKKLSINKWINFTDYLCMTGVSVKIKHIKGRNNICADLLSRIIANSPFE